MDKADENGIGRRKNRMMNTPFGKLIEKKSFGKFFLLFTMISLFYGAFANSRAAGCLWDSSLLSGLIGFLYVIMGFLSLMQMNIMKRWKNRRFESIMGFSTCFFIYDFLIVFVWKICAYFLPFSETAEAAGVFCCDLLAALTVALGYLHARNIKRASYSIQLGSKESPCRIVLLSDIHLGAFVGPKHVRRIADEVNKLDADLIVICGDLIDVNIISWQMMMRWNRSAGNSEG